MLFEGYTISTYAVSYIIFFALLWVAKGKRGNRLFDQHGFVGNRAMLIGLHVGGILVFGIIPLLARHSSDYTSYGDVNKLSLPTLITVLLTVVVFMIALRISGKKFYEIEGRQARFQSASTAFILAYFLLRAGFICTYEIWFRGFLLTDSIATVGMTMALIMNVILYSMLHIVNGKDEVLACIPFGILLCVLCIWQNAVWPAVILHLVLTLTFEIRLLTKLTTRKPLQV